MVNVTFNGTASEVLDDMRKLLAEATGSQTAPAPKGNTERTSKLAEERAKEKTAKEPATEIKKDEAPVPADSAAAVKAMIPKLMDKHLKTFIVPFLARYNGAKKGSEVPEAMHAQFLKDAERFLGMETAEAMKGVTA